MGAVFKGDRRENRKLGSQNRFGIQIPSTPCGSLTKKKKKKNISPSLTGRYSLGLHHIFISRGRVGACQRIREG